MTYLVVATFSNGDSRGYRVEADSPGEAINRVLRECIAPTLWKKPKCQELLISAGLSELSEIRKI